MKTRLSTLAVAALVVWSLKRHYADARPDDLLWILTPTAELVGVLTGERLTLQPGEGYFSRDRLFLIEKSCAGINFMIAAFGMLVFALFHRVRSVTSAAQVLGVSLLAGYSTAIGVNAARIAIAMWLAAHSAALTDISAADVHRVEGIVVYFGGLVLLYEMARRLDRGALFVDCFQRVALPLAAYYVVTLVIPFANGSARSTAFAWHALVVIVVPLMAILAGWALQALWRRSTSAA